MDDASHNARRQRLGDAARRTPQNTGGGGTSGGKGGCPLAVLLALAGLLAMMVGFAGSAPVASAARPAPAAGAIWEGQGPACTACHNTAGVTAAGYTSYGHDDIYYDVRGNVTTLGSGTAATRLAVELRDYGNGQVDASACADILSGSVVRVQLGRLRVYRTVDYAVVQSTTVNANSGGASRVCASGTQVYVGSGTYSLLAFSDQFSFRRSDGIALSGGSVTSYDSPRRYGCCG